MRRLWPWGEQFICQSVAMQLFPDHVTILSEAARFDARIRGVHHECASTDGLERNVSRGIQRGSVWIRFGFDTCEASSDASVCLGSSRRSSACQTLRGTVRPSSRSCRSAQLVRSVREGSTASRYVLKEACFSGVLGPRLNIIRLHSSNSATVRGVAVRRNHWTTPSSPGCCFTAAVNCSAVIPANSMSRSSMGQG